MISYSCKLIKKQKTKHEFVVNITTKTLNVPKLSLLSLNLSKHT